jgi:hypothetical protein
VQDFLGIELAVQAKSELTVDTPVMIPECHHSIIMQGGSDALALRCVLAACVEADSFHVALQL